MKSTILIFFIGSVISVVIDPFSNAIGSWNDWKRSTLSGIGMDGDDGSDVLELKRSPQEQFQIDIWKRDPRTTCYIICIGAPNRTKRCVYP